MLDWALDPKRKDVCIGLLFADRRRSEMAFSTVIKPMSAQS